MEQNHTFNILNDPVVPATTIAIIIKDSKVLLTKRKNVLKENGKWALPGGYISIGEKANDAIAREVKEETGLEFKEIKFLEYCDEYLPNLKIHCITLVFTGITTGNEFRESEEVSELRWFDKKEIECMQLAFGHNKILERHFK
ncbi:MAG: NUDIX domain-containing protein [Nanoarchaeota archaeon]|nr:NUDIX domain-containing protein [Nanoarchaeota archaeon]